MTTWSRSTVENHPFTRSTLHGEFMAEDEIDNVRDQPAGSARSAGQPASRGAYRPGTGAPFVISRLAEMRMCWRSGSGNMLTEDDHLA